MTEWNPADPDASKVYYDLSGWSFDQQAELTSELAEREIPHAWEGVELVVPAEVEEITDAMFIELEQRLGIDAANQEEPEALTLEADTPSTEYDLGEWEQMERELVGDSLRTAHIPFHWEDNVLLVPTSEEERVDAILDDIESGAVIPVIEQSDEAVEADFESLNNLFVASDRLRRDPSDSTGLQRLLETLEVVEPNRPPMGIELRVWRQACDLAEQLADSLVEEDANRDDAPGLAADLNALLRPLI